MARKPAQSAPLVTVGNDETVRGKRKPREYRFETVLEDGTVSANGLVITHKASALSVMAFLNSTAELTSDGQKYRFVEVILYS